MARKSRKNPVMQEKTSHVGMKVWKAALYIRLSVEFNSKRGDSLETQQQIMEAYLALCPDIEITAVYTDNGTTGRTFEREAFQQMLDDVDKAGSRKEISPACRYLYWCHYPRGRDQVR